MPAPFTIAARPGGSFDIERTQGANAPEPTAEELGLANAVTERLTWIRNNPNQIGDPAPLIAGLRQIVELGLTRDQNRDIAAARQTFSTNFGNQAPDAAAVVFVAPFRVYLEQDEIRVERLMGSAEPTDDQRKFLGELIQQERLVRALYDRGISQETRRTQRRLAAIRRLAWAAGLGLERENPDVALGRLAVQSVLADAIQENGPGVRGAYLGDLLWAYVYGCGAFILAVALFYVVTRWFNFSQAFLVPGETLSLMAVAIVSLATGAWLIAAYRLQPDSPEILTSLFATTTSASIRVALVLGFGFMGLMLFYKQVIVFSFGPSVTASGFTTALVFSKLSAAVLAGGLLGIGDAALPDAVIARSTNLVAALAPK